MRENSEYRSFVLSLVRDWLVWLERSRGRAPKTVAMYRRIMLDWWEQFGHEPLEGVSAEQLERWLQRPRFGTRSRGMVAAPATQHRDAATVRGFYKFLVARGVIEKDPSALVVTPKIKNVNPRPVSDAVWLRLWDAAGDSLYEMDRLPLILLYGAGLRREEVTVLRCHQVGSDLLVRDFVRKGGGEDTLDLGAVVEVFEQRLPHLRVAEGARLLRDTVGRRHPQDWLVGWADVGRPRKYDRHGLQDGQLHPQHLNAWLDRLCRRAGVEERLSPHRLRHSFGTNLVRAGLPLPIVSRLMNHQNVTTTMRYVRAGSSELREFLRSAGGGDETVTPSW